MQTNRSARPGGFLLLLTALLFLLTVPAGALFDHDDTAMGNGQAPIAENLSLTTYRDVGICGALAAVDPQGDPVTFRVTKNPARGSLAFGTEGDPAFTYTPYEGKTGKDSFTYVAEDSQGNVSQPATVSVKIKKADTKVTYADMSGHPAHRAAIALAERKLFVGEQLGDTWFFRPETPVSREEFLAMAMDVVGLDTMESSPLSGFADGETIAVWARPYVASALMSGMVQGCGTDPAGALFEPARTMTQTEAAVLLDRLLRLSDVPSDGEIPTAAPAWAAQPVANLQAVGVLKGDAALSASLTRGDAAQMLLSAMEVLDFRAQRW